MKKLLFLLLTILILVLVGIFIYLTYQPREKKISDSPQDNNIAEIIPVDKKIVNYLENSVLEPNFEGKVFADYYEIGLKEKELFVWAYISEYYKEESELKQGTARSGPLKLILNSDGSIKNHWEPRPGEEYAQSIKENFPQEFSRVALNFQTQNKEILKNLKESVKEKAERQFLEIEKKEIPKGETSEIRLEANKTTGYTWHYKIENKDIARVVSDRYEESDSKKEVLGAPGERILEVKGLKQGETFIEFKYYRDWQPEQIEKSKKIKIIVTGESQADFDIPDLDTEYISAQDWDLKVINSEESLPEGIKTEENKLFCSQNYIPQKINDRKYCLKKQVEGAAGKEYIKYDYIVLKQGKILKLNFTVIKPNCGNYPEAERAECEKESEDFNSDFLATQVIASLED